MGIILGVQQLTHRVVVRCYAKVEIIVDFAVDELLDIIIVTELKTTLARTRNASIWHRGFYSWWGARDVKQSYSDGILLLVQDEWAKYVQKVDYWAGRLIWIDFAFPGGLKLRCVGVYAPPVSAELRALVTRLQSVLVSASTCGYQIILAGDLNGVFNPSQDRIPRHVSSAPDTTLMQFLASQGLADMYRTVHPYDHSLHSMTWVNPADSLSGSHIDYILATPDLASRVAHSQVISVPGLATDHQLLFASFQTGMLTKCVQRSTLRRFMKAQNVWDFKAMTQENWISFTQVSEKQAEMQLPGATWGNLASFLQQESIDVIWEVFLEVLNTTATKLFHSVVLEESHAPLRRKFLLIVGFALLVSSCAVLQPSGLQILGKPTWQQDR